MLRKNCDSIHGLTNLHNMENQWLPEKVFFDGSSVLHAHINLIREFLYTYTQVCRQNHIRHAPDDVLTYLKTFESRQQQLSLF